VTQREDDDDRDPAADHPATLDYFAPRAPDRVDSRGLTTSAVLLLLSWLPYLCGVVNASTSTTSYVPTITSAHVNASVLFLGIGLLVAVVSLFRFVAARYYFGAAIAGGVVLMQVTVAGCIGLA
jgi:hypothetical protein